MGVTGQNGCHRECSSWAPPLLQQEVGINMYYRQTFKLASRSESYALSALKTHLFAVFQIFVEAKRTSPSIIYIPSIGQWWETVGPALRATFLSLLSSIPAFAPIFLLATCSIEYRDLSDEVQKTKMGHCSHSTTREKCVFDG